MHIKFMVEAKKCQYQGALCVRFAGFTLADGMGIAPSMQIASLDCSLVICCINSLFPELKTKALTTKALFNREREFGGNVRKHAIVFLTALAVSGSIILPGLPWAQNASPPARAGALESPIGKVIATTGAVTIEHVAAVVVQASVSPVGQAKVGDLVYRGDVLQTGRDGKVDLTFADGTTFNVSSNARMVLDEFVYNPSSTSNSTLFSLTRGTFNFVAGKVATTGDMKISTPVGTMGIRGTAPRVEIADNGTVIFSTLIEETASGPAGTPGGGQDNRRAPPQRPR